MKTVSPKKKIGQHFLNDINIAKKIKTIRFGQQGAKPDGKPRKGESRAITMKRRSFKARHRRNIAKGRMSAAYWANKVKW